jgi:L-threonylcarbamoyladenylate synthase
VGARRQGDAGGRSRARLKTFTAIDRRLDDEALAALRATLTAGEIVIYPTDTLYALGGLALRAEAATRVRAAKGREAQKALPLVAADLEQVESLSASVPDPARVLARVFWPGPLTLVLRAADAVPAEITAGTGTIAVRIPASELTRLLCEQAGPLISTSANRAGEPPALTCREAQAAVGESAAAAIDAGPGRRAPSTIVDMTVNPPRLLREGAVAWDDVRRHLSGV